MDDQTWGLQFVKVNIEDNEFTTLLILKGVPEDYARQIFYKVKNEFVENRNKPDCVIDLIDEDDSIVDDFGITYSQAKTIAEMLGHKIN